MTPLRIQLRRAKGWRLPANTVVCSRPGRWGNPFIVHPAAKAQDARGFDQIRCIVETFRLHLVNNLLPKCTAAEVRSELRGKNLACWCKLCPKHRDGKRLLEHCPDCAPCHVDVLGRVANETL